MGKVVDLSMNPACHLACVFCCDHGVGTAGLTTDEVKSFLDLRRSEGCDEISERGFA